MSVDMPTPSPDLPPERPGPPPLRIHHLLVCTAVTAIAFASYRLLVVQEVPVQFFSRPAWSMGIGISGIGLVIQAIGITLAIYAVYWQAKGIAAFREPGQWLLWTFPYAILEPVINLLIFPALYSVLYDERPWQKYLFLWELGDIVRALWWTAIYLVLLALPISFFAWCAWRIADTRLWRLVFAFFSAGFLGWHVALYFAFATLNRVSPYLVSTVHVCVPSLVAAILVSCALGNDFTTGQTRTWTHWTGAALFVVSRVWTIFTILFWWLQSR